MATISVCVCDNCGVRNETSPEEEHAHLGAARVPSGWADVVIMHVVARAPKPEAQPLDVTGSAGRAYFAETLNSMLTLVKDTSVSEKDARRAIAEVARTLVHLDPDIGPRDQYHEHAPQTRIAALLCPACWARLDTLLESSPIRFNKHENVGPYGILGA